MAEGKVRFQMRISQDTDRRIKAAIPLTNCQSQNEFVETALRFYCDHLSLKETGDFLPPILTAALRGTVQSSESHICRMLFKLAVEMSMMMNVLAAGLEIRDEDLRQLRGRCVREVKQTNGSISFKDAVAYQRGD